MATIIYRLSSKVDKASGKAKIVVDVSVSRTFRVRGNTLLYVRPKDWDEKAQTLRKVSRIAKRETQMELEDLRSKLGRLKDHISRSILETENLEEMTSTEDRQDWITFVIESFYDPCAKLVKYKNLSFQEFAKVYVKIRSEEDGWKKANSSAPNQKKEWDNACYDKLCAVQTQINLMNPDLMMDDITGSTLDEYQKFLVKKGYYNNTIQNHISYFKQILVWANDRGYLKHGKEVVSHKTPKLKINPPQAVNFLKWDEFKRLYEHKFEPGQEHLELTRDRFCFCCATSLRHSDLCILKKSYFDDVDNPTSFSFVSQKTADDLTIFLNDYSKELYLKYKDVPTPDGLLFPPKSNQKMNDQLKEIAKILGFTREVTKMQWNGVDRVIVTEPLCDVIGTHAARRTFVVHALEEGMSPQIVMSFTGHEEYDSLKPYIAITDKTRKNLMTTMFSK